MLLVSFHVFFPQFSKDIFKVKEQGCVGWEVGGFYSKDQVSIQSCSFLAVAWQCAAAPFVLCLVVNKHRLRQSDPEAMKSWKTFTMSRLQLSRWAPLMVKTHSLNWSFLSLLSLHIVLLPSWRKMSLPLHNHKHGSHSSTRSRCVYHLRERLFTVSDNNKDENDHAFMKCSSFCVTDSKQSCLFTCNHCILSLLGMKIISNYYSVTA